MQYLGFNDNKKIGMFLLLVSIICYCLGVMFIFRRSLILMANILFLLGLYFFIGISGIIKFFTKKGKIQGSGVYFIGLILIVIYFTFIGTLMQLFGLFIIFRSFLPDFYDYLCRIPFIGYYLSKSKMDYLQKVIKYKIPLIKLPETQIIEYEQQPPHEPNSQTTNLIILKNICQLFYTIQKIFMDDQNNQTNNNQVQSLKTLLVQILHKNTAYDCMPINSSINSVDKSISLYDAINILISKELEELLVWDQQKCKWIWMLTLVDAIRFITHALKSLLRHGEVNFSDFQRQKEQKKGQMISTIFQCNKDQLEQVICCLQQKRIQEIIQQIQKNSPAKSYIRLKAVQKQSKIQFVIMTMSYENIHRIIIQDSQSHMFISVLNFKDIFLYILRIANESPITYYSTIDIQSLLQAGQAKNIEIQQSRPLWQAFQILTDRDKSLWINVVSTDGKFKGILFRQDFRGIFQGWHVDYLWMSVGEFIQWKKASQTGNIPEYRFFQPSQYTRDIIWKMVMSKRNAIVWIDSEGRVKATIGLMEIFRLYVP